MLLVVSWHNFIMFWYIINTLQISHNILRIYQRKGITNIVGLIKFVEYLLGIEDPDHKFLTAAVEMDLNRI